MPELILVRARTQPKSPIALPRRREFGFTLAELAVVLVILALLSGSMLVPLGSRMEARDRQTTLERLRDIQQALTGFAIIHGRLPCPSTETDPTHPGYGVEDPPPCNITLEGRLPWRTLAMPATDAWGSERVQATESWAGHWRYHVDQGFAAGPITVASLPADNLQIRAADGRRITVTDSQAVAVVFSSGANRSADGLNASYSAVQPQYQAGEPTTSFDDLLVWIGRPLLIARMAQAGRL
ncbi:MAG TPA: type II secretion system protein [Thauera sp.]|jgi:prepilin-type N-terminal cleavage/methylation domain-containing protein|nr:type II secretion system protein [Thauera sp.]